MAGHVTFFGYTVVPFSPADLASITNEVPGMIRTVCPHCELSQTLAEESAGRRRLCRGCLRPFVPAILERVEESPLAAAVIDTPARHVRENSPAEAASAPQPLFSAPLPVAQEIPSPTAALPGESTISLDQDVTASLLTSLVPASGTPPRRVGRFEWTSYVTPLDEGGVALARDVFNGQQAAAVVHELDPTSADASRLLADYAPFSEVRHPAFASILSSERTPDGVVCFAQWPGGESLVVRQERLGNFSARTAARWTRDLARLLVDIADQGVSLKELDPALIHLTAGQGLVLLPCRSETHPENASHEVRSCRLLGALLSRLLTGRRPQEGRPLTFPDHARPPQAIESLCGRLWTTDESRAVMTPSAVARFLDAWLVERQAEAEPDEFWALSNARQVGVTFVAALIATFCLLDVGRIPLALVCSLLAASIEFLVRRGLRRSPSRAATPALIPPDDEPRASWPRWLPLDHVPATACVAVALLPVGGLTASIFGGTATWLAQRRIPLVAGSPWLDARLGAILTALITLIPLWTATASQAVEVRIVGAIALPIAMVVASLLGTTLRSLHAYDTEADTAWFPAFLGLLGAGIVGIALLLVADWRQSLPHFYVPYIRFGLARTVALVILGLVWGLRLGRSLPTRSAHRALVLGGVSAAATLWFLDWQAPEWFRLLWIDVPRYRGAGFSWFVGNLMVTFVLGAALHLGVVWCGRETPEGNTKTLRFGVRSPSRWRFVAGSAAFVLALVIGANVLPPAIRCHLTGPWPDAVGHVERRTVFGIPTSPFRPQSFGGPQIEVPSLLSPDGRFLLTWVGVKPTTTESPWQLFHGAPTFHSLSVWDTSTGKRLWTRRLSGFDPLNYQSPSAFSADGTTLSFVSHRPTSSERTPTRLTMYDSRRGALIDSETMVFAVSPSGRQAIAMSSLEESDRRWEIRPVGRAFVPFVADGPKSSRDHMRWQRCEWEFVAVSNQTTLTISSRDDRDPSDGPKLDDVLLRPADSTDDSPNLLRNGGFEESETSEKDAIVTLSAGATSLPGWTILGQGVDLVTDYWENAQGRRSLDLNAVYGRGGVEQTVKTEKGLRYRLTFSLAGIVNTDLPETVLGVHAGGGMPTQPLSMELLGAAPAPLEEVAFPPDDRWLAVTLRESPVVVRVWDPANRTTLLEQTGSRIGGVSPDGSVLALRGYSAGSNMTLFDTDTWTEIRGVSIGKASDRTLVTGDVDRPVLTIRSTDDRTGSFTALFGGIQYVEECRDALSGHALWTLPGVSSVLAADGRTAAVVRDDLSGSILVYDLARRRWPLIVFIAASCGLIAITFVRGPREANGVRETDPVLRSTSAG